MGAFGGEYLGGGGANTPRRTRNDSNTSCQFTSRGVHY
jgi:hypothetical protein